MQPGIARTLIFNISTGRKKALVWVTRMTRSRRRQSRKGSKKSKGKPEVDKKKDMGTESEDIFSEDDSLVGDVPDGEDVFEGGMEDDPFPEDDLEDIGDDLDAPVSEGRGSRKSAPSPPLFSGLKDSVCRIRQTSSSWMKEEKWLLLSLLGIFLFGFFIRTYYSWDLSKSMGWAISGNDGFYHRHTIDYIENVGKLMVFDPMRNYPLGGLNPNPPFFQWLSATAALVLAPIASLWGWDLYTTTSFVVAATPAFWGIMTAVPVYFITREMFGKKPAIIATLLIALMPSNIERAPFSVLDHDAAVLFFVEVSVFFMFKAFKHLPDDKWVRSWFDPSDISKGVIYFFKENQIAVLYALMGGISMGTVALIWKGFPYIFVIFLVYYIAILFFNRIRNVDSMGVFLLTFIGFASALTLAFPYYSQFETNTWVQAFYILLAIVVLGAILIPTRDSPWIVVIPSMIMVAVAGIGLLQLLYPDVAAQLLSGGGYFVKSRVYSTIAEAQAPALSRLAFSYGPAVFYMSLIALIFLAYDLPKHWKKESFLILMWAGVAIYMSLTAVRFMFNATPVFAILGGWMTWRLLEWGDPQVFKLKRLEPMFVYIYSLLVVLGVILVSYWWLFMHTDQYEWFQAAMGLGILSVFIMLLIMFIAFRYSLFYTYLSLLALGMGWLVYWGYNEPDLFYFSLVVLSIFMAPMILFLLWRFKISTRVRLDIRHTGLALFVCLVILLPAFWFAFDAGIPYEKKREVDPTNEMFGAFGHSFVSDYWVDCFDWLSEQDTDLPEEDRPAFVSWWDYGFWCIDLGKHPAAAENFQAGYQYAGSILAAQNETETVSLTIARLLEGDYYTNDPGLSEDVMELLEDHLGEEKAENVSHIMGIYHWPQEEYEEYGRYIENHPDLYGNMGPDDDPEDEDEDGDFQEPLDVSEGNAMLAGIKVELWPIGLEGCVNLLKDLEDTTEKSIRYFGADYRLFPFSARNTGIFYAPIKLADLDVDDYLIYKAQVQEYDKDGNEIGSPSTDSIEDAEKKMETNSDPAYKDWKYGRYRIVDYALEYTEAFYNTMFYRIYIGYSADEIGHSNDQAIPGISQELTQAREKHGWNLTHYRLVYETLYYSEESQENASFPGDFDAMNSPDALEAYKADGGSLQSGLGQGVFMLKYYHGAVVQGQVKTRSGAAVPNARVTVWDDFSVPHDYTYTDENGNYELLVPFGDHVTLLASRGGFGSGDQAISQRISQTESIPLNTTEFIVTDDQAMRRGGWNDWHIKRDLIVDDSNLTGLAYWDSDDDDKYSDDTDTAILSGTVKLESKDEDLELNYTIDLDGTSKYFLPNIVPGDYKLIYQDGEHSVSISDSFTVNPDEAKTQDISIAPASIAGKCLYENGTNATEIELRLEDGTTGEVLIQETDDTGEFRFGPLFPGNYTGSVSVPGYLDMKETLRLSEGETNTTNVTLKRVIPITGRAYLDLNGNGYYNDGEGRKGVRLEFIPDSANDTTVVVYTDFQGSFKADLVTGNYTMMGRAVTDDDRFVSIGERKYYSPEMDVQVNVPLHRTGTVTGSVFVSSDVKSVPGYEGTELQGRADLTLTNDATGVTFGIPTNSSGQFRADVPHGRYTLWGEFPDENLTLVLMEKVVVDSSNPLVDIQAFYHFPVTITGRVFWDRDEDGIYSEYEGSAINLTEPDVEIDVLDEAPAGAGTYVDSEEGIQGFTVWVEGENGTKKIQSGPEGDFTVTVIPGDFTVWVEDDRLSPDRVEVPVSSSVRSASSQAFANLTVDPVGVKITGSLWADGDGDGKIGVDETLEGIELIIDGVQMGTSNLTSVTGDDGLYSGTFKPGTYAISVDHDTTLDGSRVWYNMSRGLEVPLGGDDIILNWEATLSVETVGSVALEDGDRLDNYTFAFINGDMDIRHNVTTDRNGSFSRFIPAGTYSVFLTHRDGDTEYVLLRSVDVTPGMGTLDLTLEIGVKLTGTTIFDGNPPNEMLKDGHVSDVELTFTAEGDATTVSDSRGQYSINLLGNRTYQVIGELDREEDSTQDQGMWVHYEFEGTLELGEEDTVLNISMTRLIRVEGVTLYDRDRNKLIEWGETSESPEITFPPEPLPNVPLIFTDDDGNTFKTSSNESSKYAINLLPGNYSIEIDPPEGFELPPFNDRIQVVENKSILDIFLRPENVTVSGYVYKDANRNGTQEDDEKPLTRFDIHFIPREAEGTDAPMGAEKRLTVESEKGEFITGVMPGEYDVKVISYKDGIWTHSRYLRLNITEDVNMVLPVGRGLYFNGSLFATLHDDTKIYNLSTEMLETELSLEKKDSAMDIPIPVTNGYFSGVLVEEGDYIVHCSYVAQEFEMDVIYENATELFVNSSLKYHNIQLEKREEKKVELELLDLDNPRINVSSGDVREFEFDIKNTGNVPDMEVTFGSNLESSRYTDDNDNPNTFYREDGSDPDDLWEVEYTPEKIKLNPNEKATIRMTVRVAKNPDFSSTLTVQPKPAGMEGTLSLTFQTSKIKSFKLTAKEALEEGGTVVNKGVEAGQKMYIHMILDNTGNYVEDYEITYRDVGNDRNMTDHPWKVRIGNSIDSLEEIGEGGFTKNVRPDVKEEEKQQQEIILEVVSPSNDSAFDELELEVVARAKSYGGEEKLDINLRIDKPDVFITPEDVVLINQDMSRGDNLTVNVTVHCTGTDVSGVNVSLLWDDEPILSENISKITENEQAYVEFSFNLSQRGVNTSALEVHKLEIVLDRQNSIIEKSDFNNNVLFDKIETGPPEEPDEPPMRLLLFLLSVAIAVLALILYFKWKRRI